MTSVPRLKTRVYQISALKHLLNAACLSTAASRMVLVEDEAGTFSGSDSPYFIFNISFITRL